MDERNGTTPPANGQRKSLRYIQGFHPLNWIRNHVEDLKQIFKMAAAPTMVNALIFSSYWVDHFREFMYIMAILAHATVTPAFPRAKLININFSFVILFALSYCWALLAGWCAVKAREHTGQLEAYSSSAATIIAIFLLVGCFFSFAGRSYYAKWTLGWILTGIYLTATLPALIELQTMDEVIAVASLVIESFYAGQAIGVAIGLLIFPRSCRTVFMKSVEDSLLALSNAIKAQPECLERLVHEIGTRSDQDGPIRQVKTYIDAFSASAAKVQGQVEVAGQEWTYSHFSRGDLKAMANHLTMISAPLVGLKSLADKVLLALTEDLSTFGESSATEHREFITTMKSYAEDITNTIEDRIHHAMRRLRPRSSASDRTEDACLKGTCSHISSFEKSLFKYRSLKGEMADTAEQYMVQQMIRDTRGLDKTLPYGALLGCFLSSHLILLLSATAYELYNMLLFLEETSHKKRKLYTPIQNLFSDIRKGARNLFQGDSSHALYGVVFSRISPSMDREVDHMPPNNVSEKVGDYIRRSWKFFGSPHTAFGVRGALAVFSIAILAFLEDEHAFYNRERFLWALFSILLCLDRHAGSSTIKLLFRFSATLLSMVASYVIWYMPDQKVPGIIVFLFVWYAVLSYWECKSPKYGPAAFTAVVAATVMIANQLQIRKLGAAAVAASGQAVYPSYIFFPLRLAQVTLGVLAAYFWTLFPSPMPEHTELRRQAGETLLNLATFSTSVHQSVSIQFGLRQTTGATSAANHLDRLHSRHRAHFTEHQVLMSKMQAAMKTLPFEFNLGGKFPLRTYQQICACISRLGDLVVLIGYMSHTLDGARLAAEMDTPNADVQSHLVPTGIATRLVLLCSSLKSGHPLPPGVRVLKVPDLRHFLDRRVATDETFAVASLIHSANFMITRELTELTSLVAEVVGTLDFSLPLEELDAEV